MEGKISQKIGKRYGEQNNKFIIHIYDELCGLHEDHVTKRCRAQDQEACMFVNIYNT